MKNYQYSCLSLGFFSVAIAISFGIATGSYAKHFVCKNIPAEGGGEQTAEFDSNKPEHRDIKTSPYNHVECDISAGLFQCRFIPTPNTPYILSDSFSSMTIDGNAMQFAYLLWNPGESGGESGMITCSAKEADVVLDHNYSCQVSRTETSEKLGTLDLSANGRLGILDTPYGQVKCLQKQSGAECFSSKGFANYSQKVSYSASVARGASGLHTEVVMIDKDNKKITLSVNCLSSSIDHKPLDQEIKVTGTWNEVSTHGISGVSNSFKPLTNLIDVNGRTAFYEQMPDDGSVTRRIYDGDLALWSENITPGPTCNLFFDSWIKSTGNQSVIFCENQLFHQNIDNLSWISFPDFESRWHYDATVEIGGQSVMMWGGEGSDSAYHPDGYVFDVNTNLSKPTSTTNAPDGRSYPLIIPMDKDRFFVWGGAVISNPLNAKADGGIYQTSTDTWTTIKAPETIIPLLAETSSGNSSGWQNFDPGNRLFHGVWTGTEVMIVGGWSKDIGYLHIVQFYNPDTNSWRTESLNPVPEMPMGASSAVNKYGFLLAGGDYRYRKDLNDSSAWFYRFSTKQWEKVTPHSALNKSYITVGPTYDGFMVYSKDRLSGKFQINELKL